MNYRNKLLPFDELLSAVHRERQLGKTIVTTNGCFDLLHYGHLAYLQEARNYGGDYGILVVGVNSDRSVRQLKGARRPLIPENERAALIAGLECVSYVFVFDEDNPSGWIDLLRPDFHVKGKDYQDRTDLPECQSLASYGGKFATTKTHLLASTDIIRRVLQIYDTLETKA